MASRHLDPTIHGLAQAPIEGPAEMKVPYLSQRPDAQARHSLPVLTGTISSCRLLHLLFLVTTHISLSPIPLAQATLRLLFVLAAQAPQ